MNAPKVRQVSREVELVGDDRETSSLLQIELGASHQVAGRQEILHPLSDRRLRVNQLLHVDRVTNCILIELGVLEVLDQTRFSSQ